MSTHIGAARGEIAPRVLLPGDPLRATWIAERYLTGPRRYSTVRNMYGYTGTYQGTAVSVQGTGMGMPSASIYLHELLAEYDVRTLIRVGTCGALDASLQLSALVAASGASTDSAMNRVRFGGLVDYAPVADFTLLRSAVDAAARRHLDLRVGPVFSADAFYSDQPAVLEQLEKYGTLAVEMETAALYTLAARFRARALALLTVSDVLATGERCSAEARERTLDAMVTLALDIAVGPAGAEAGVTGGP